jgi:HAD superfamily hydrolase (TIGR01509 family)
MIKAVIFDMDGVISDSEPLMDSYFVNYFKNLNLEISKDILRRFRGVSSEHFWTKLKEMYDLPNPIDSYIQDFRYEYLEYLKSIDDLKPIDGVEELIVSIRQNGIHTALATSGSKVRMNTVLDLLKMQNCFEVKLSAQDVLNAKPDPELFFLAAKLLAANPEECIAIEDSINGVTAAKRAGMRCIGFKQNDDNDQDLSKADFIVNAFDESLMKKILSLS